MAGSISGNVGIANATVTYAGAVSGLVLADESGNYEIDSLPNGDYTVTPMLAGYVFSPVSQTVTVSCGFF